MLLIPLFRYLNICKTIVYALFVVIFSVDAKAQAISEPRAFIHWQKQKTKASAVHALIRNLEGNLVFVGTANKKGKDINFMVMDTSGRILKDTIIIGGDKNDEANAVCNTRDGGFLIAGYTRSSKLYYVGKSDGWVVKTDFNGKPLWEALIGTGGEDAFTSVAEDEKGNFFVAGQSNNALWVVKISSKGEKLWEKRLEGTARQGRSIAYSRRTGLAVVTGFDTKGRVETLYLTGFNSEGKIVFDKSYTDAAGEKIVEMPNGNWLVAGRRFTFKSDQDMLLLQTDSMGVALESHTFGGAWEDGAQALVFDPISNTLCLAGYSYSQVRDAHNAQLWLVKSDLKGNELWKKRAYFGGKDDEGANDLLLTPEGQLFAIAYKGLDKKPWLIGFGTVINREEIINTPNISTEQGIASTNDSIKATFGPNERGFYEFTLTNNSTSPVYPLAVTVSATRPSAEGLWVLPKIEMGYLLAGESRSITIPLSISDSVATDSSRFVVNFFVKNEKIGTSTSFDVVTKAVLRPRLIITESSFLADRTSQTGVGVNGEFTKNGSNRLTLKLTIKNTGSLKAEQTKVSFICPLNIKAFTPRIVEIGELEIDSIQTIDFDFQPEGTYEDSIVVIQVAVLEKMGQGDTYQEMSVKLKKPQLAAITDSNLSHSYNTAPVGTTNGSNILDISWKHPDVDYGILDFSEDKPGMKLKIKVKWDRRLVDSNIHVYLNGKDLKGVKAKVAPITCIEDELNNTCTCIFDINVLLETGVNTLQAKVKYGTVEKETRKITVTCQAKKPNLYILALGIPRPGLAFSTKDAQDFAKIWQHQEGKLFNKVFTMIRNTEGLTNRDSICFVLDSLALAFKRQKGISPNDYLIIYISSHGFLDEDDDESFNIECSDFTQTIPPFKKIDFEQDILKKILPIKCNQLLFIDACRSGKAIQLSGRLTRLLQNRTGDFLYVLSSDANEYSYEDKVWQNSAFTKALVEAFSNQKVQTHQGLLIADANQDAVLTIDELMLFLKKRVNYIVSQEKKGKQTPCIYPQNSEKQQAKNEFQIYKF